MSRDTLVPQVVTGFMRSRSMCRVAMLLGVTVMLSAEPNLTGVTEHPCVLLTAETLSSLKAKAADMTQNRFGFSTGEAWQQFKAKADEFLEAEPYHYRVNIPR